MLSTKTERDEYFQNVVDSYLATAIWVRFDTEDNISVNDIDLDTRLQAIQDCGNFLVKLDYDVQSIPSSQFGHDFWLTRTHQGAGFWDRDLGEFGELLTKISHTYSDITPVIGDDGKVYFE